MRVEDARQSRTGATVVYTLLITYKRKNPDYLFCCFEGDDVKYYMPRVERHCNYEQENVVHFTCTGKEEVLRLYRLVNNSTDLTGLKILYFIDKDFDYSLSNPTRTYVYETSGYSIENNYTTNRAFARILKNEFFYQEEDREFMDLMSKFSLRHADFHNATILLNAFLSCQRDAYNQGIGTRLLLDNFNLSSIITSIELDATEGEYDLDDLYRIFPGAARIPEVIINERIELMSSTDMGKFFRGKFEIYFLFAFIDAINRAFNNPALGLARRPGYKLNLSKKNVISELTQYADTNPCLIEYLANPAIRQ